MERFRRPRRAIRVATLVAALFLCAPVAGAAHESADDPAVTHGDTARELGGVAAAQELEETAIADGRGRAATGSDAAGDAQVASAWCGSPQANDDLASAVNPGLPAVKVVYAFPADRPDRFRLMAGALQHAALTVTRFVASESGGRKTIRFDTGTSCGPAYLDVTWMPLSRARAGYLDGSGNPLFAEVKAEVESRLSAPPAARNQLVFVDNLLSGASFGQAELLRGADQPGPDNANNEGGQFAFLWGQDGFDAERGQDYELPLLMLHEAAHTLGAVQLSAPHSTGGGHCGDGADVMCYSEADPSDRKITACSDTGAALVQFDCNKDDYFNPNPPAGSYLATHWNLYNSTFLGGCDELGSFCTAQAPPPTDQTGTAATARRSRTRSAALKALRRGRTAGRRLGRMTVKVRGASASLSTTRLRLGAGRWRLRSCLQPGSASATASRGARSATTRTAARASAGGRCRTRTVRVRGRRSVTAPALTLTAPSGTAFVAGSVDVRRIGGRGARASSASRIGPRAPLSIRLG